MVDDTLTIDINMAPVSPAGGALPAEDTERRRQHTINEKFRKDMEKAQEDIEYNSFKIDEGYKLVFEKLRLANLSEDFRKGSSPPDMNKKLWKATARKETVRGKKRVMDPKLYSSFEGDVTGISSGIVSDTMTKNEKKAKKQLKSARKAYERALISGDTAKIREAEFKLDTLENIEPQTLADAKSKAAKQAQDTQSDKQRKKEKKERAREEKKRKRKLLADFKKEIKKENKKLLESEGMNYNRIAKGLDEFGGWDSTTRKKLLKTAAKANSWLDRSRTLSQRLKTRGVYHFAAAALNPERTVGKVALNLLSLAGPKGALLASAITIILSSPEVIKAFIKVFGRKGGPLNRDWRRLIENETTGFLSLEEQKRRDLGLDGFIVSPDVGYKPVDETSVYNSQLLRDEVRLNKLSQGEKVQFSR